MMRWYEWPVLWLAFFVPCAVVVAGLSQTGGPLRTHPDRQGLLLVLVPLGPTLLVGGLNTVLRRWPPR